MTDMMWQDVLCCKCFGGPRHGATRWRMVWYDPGEDAGARASTHPGARPRAGGPLWAQGGAGGGGAAAGPAAGRGELSEANHTVHRCATCLFGTCRDKKFGGFRQLALVSLNVAELCGFLWILRDSQNSANSANV